MPLVEDFYAVTDMFYLRIGVLLFVSSYYNIAVFRLKLDCTAFAVELGGGYECGAATTERLKHRIAFMAAVIDELGT